MMRLKLVAAEVNLNHLLKLIQAKNMKVIKFQKIPSKKISFLLFRKWKKPSKKMVMAQWMEMKTDQEKKLQKMIAMGQGYLQIYFMVEHS